MRHYSIEPRTRRYVEGNGFLSFARNLSNKSRKQLLDAGLDALKTASKKVVNKTVERTCKFLGKKVAEKIVKTKHLIDENPRNIEEIIILSEKRKEILNESRQVLEKWNTIKYLSH